VSSRGLKRCAGQPDRTDHRKLRRAGAEAELQAFEAMSHIKFDPFVTEAKEVFTEIASFFDKHLGK